tara:strand:- start:9 stop:521 length:513 start_codon:yes stop_codon:yes gene_type:complete
MIMPTVIAHGASDYQFIMRNQTLQPSEAKLLDNTTMIFFNVADENRTIKMDIDKDGVDDVECLTTPYNATSNADECRIWIEPGVWEAGNYGVRIMSNDSLWYVLNLVVSLDNHTETSNFDLTVPNYSLNENLIDSSEDDKTTPVKIYQLALLVVLIAGLLLTIKRDEING